MIMYALLMTFMYVEVISVKCPTTASKWQNKASRFNCQHPLTYHCILNDNEELVETCMGHDTVKEYKDGCPWIIFRGKEAVFGFPFLPCNNSRCPTKDHPGYRTDMLYLYPGCFDRKDKRIIFRTYQDNTTAKDQKPRSGEGTNKESLAPVVSLICVSVILMLLIFVFVIFGIRRWKRRHGRKEILNIKYPTEETKFLDKYELFPEDTEYAEKFIETEAMTRMSKLLAKERLIMLHGVCGAGKTQAARWYGLQCRKRSKDSIVWKIECDSIEKMLFSLKDLCTELKLFFLDDFNFTDTEMVVLNYAKRVAQNLMARFGEHVIIFEDLTQTMRDTGRSVVEHLLKQPSLKCIITTQDRNLFDDLGILPEQNIIEISSFSDQDAILFFGPHFGKEEHLKELARFLFHLPLALMSAKSYMKSCKMKANVMLSHLIMEEKTYGSPKSSDIDISLFKPLIRIVMIIRKENTSIFELMTYLQFIEPHEIPVYLFNFLQPSQNLINAEKTTNLLVKKVQQFSFGKIHGNYEVKYQDKRTLDVKPFITLVMKAMTNKTERRQLLIDVLKSCAWLLCKDQGQKIDRERCMDVLPHAKKALSFTKIYFQEKQSVLEVLSTIMVSERVRFTLQYIGQIRESEETSDFTLAICYKLLGTSYEDLAEEFSLPLSEDRLLITSKKLAEKIESILCKKLEIDKEGDVEQYATEYILNKHRLVHEREMFKDIFESELEYGVRFSEKDVEKLSELGYKVTGGSLGRFFIFEAIVLVFLSYGLRVLRKTVSTDTRKKMFHHVFVAYHLGQSLKEEFSRFPPYCALESDLNGRMEFLLFEKIDDTETDEKRLESLYHVEETLLEISEQDSETKYFLSGICIRKTGDWNHKLNCYMKLLQCCKEIIKTTSDNTCRSKYRKKAQNHADRMEECLKQIIQEEKLKSAYKSQEAKQTLVSHHLENNDHKKATFLLENMKHCDMENLENFVTPLDLRDFILLCDCYTRAENQEGLSRIRGSLESLQDKLNTEYSEAFFLYKQLCSKLGYEASVGMTEMPLQTDTP